MYDKPKVTIDLAEYNELLAIKENSALKPGEIDQSKFFYVEFDPRDFNHNTSIGMNGGFDRLIMEMQGYCRKNTGRYFNELEISMGRLAANAELHYLKAPLNGR